MSSHAAALHGTCPVAFCTGSVWLLLFFSFVYPVFCSLADSIRQLRILAGAVREKEPLSLT